MWVVYVTLTNFLLHHQSLLVALGQSIGLICELQLLLDDEVAVVFVVDAVGVVEIIEMFHVCKIVYKLPILVKMRLVVRFLLFRFL